MKSIPREQWTKIQEGTEVHVVRKDGTQVLGIAHAVNYYGMHVGPYYVNWQHVKLLDVEEPPADELVTKIKVAMAIEQDERYESGQSATRMSGASIDRIARLVADVARKHYA